MTEYPEDVWEQTETIHCPARDCKGMLLTNKYRHEYKCSDCDKLWMPVTEWREVGEEE